MLIYEHYAETLGSNTFRRYQLSASLMFAILFSCISCSIDTIAVHLYMLLLCSCCRQIQGLIYMLIAQTITQPLSLAEQGMPNACGTSGNSTAGGSETFTPQDWTGNWIRIGSVVFDSFQFPGNAALLL